MKLKTGLSLLITGAGLSLAIIGCKKDPAPAPIPTSVETVDKDVSVASDNSLADAAFNDVQNITDQAANGALVFYSPTYNGGSSQSNGSYEKSSCATITHDTTSSPHILTINFGTTNCLCNDGKYRRGQINVSYSGHYRDSASVHTITFTDYFVNDNQLLGTKTVTNNGHNSNGNLTFSINVDGSLIKANNGGTVTWQSTRVREWLEGESTLVWSDDVYSITGSSSGVSANGTSYTAVITTALRRALNCHWFDSGILEVTPSGLPVRIFNYGAGTCDSDATVTINGISYPFTMS